MLKRVYHLKKLFCTLVFEVTESDSYASQNADHKVLTCVWDFSNSFSL